MEQGSVENGNGGRRLINKPVLPFLEPTLTIYIFNFFYMSRYWYSILNEYKKTHNFEVHIEFILQVFKPFFSLPADKHVGIVFYQKKKYQFDTLFQ